MKIEIELWAALLGLLVTTAAGSFIGCWVFVKVFEWNKVTVRTKLDVSEDALKKILTIKEKTK